MPDTAPLQYHLKDENSNSSLRRSSSFFNLNGRDYHLDSAIGEGSYTKVRRFNSRSHDESLIVRSPLPSSFPFSQAYKHARMFNLLYPGGVRLFYWDKQGRPHEAGLSSGLVSNDQISTWRMIMLGFDGRVGEYVFIHPDSSRQFKALLRIAEALHRFHERGIVHGNVHPDSFIISRDLEIAHAINIDYSSFLGEKAVTFSCIFGSHYFAPERIASVRNRPDADIRQDVFSFAKLVDFTMRESSISTPALRELVENGLKKEVDARPSTMEEFFEPLHEAIEKMPQQLTCCYYLDELNFHALSVAVFENKTNRLLIALQKIHDAMFNAQTSFFKADDLNPLLIRGRSEDQLLNILRYVAEHRKSRIAKAFKILDSCNDLNIKTAAVVQAVHLAAFKRSGIFSDTNAYGSNCYLYSSAKSASKDNPLDTASIRNLIQDNPSSRIAMVANTVGFSDESELEERSARQLGRQT